MGEPSGARGVWLSGSRGCGYDPPVDLGEWCDAGECSRFAGGVGVIGESADRNQG
ncbi:MAG: hypothetical protein OXO49_00695 [Gammaproteobacteria bacterium]|nr:hypothetical protein [Gammaproteobacteria bacterium]MDE0251497.1 hypothetical protein [Gammaproteobacteria bacterium]MDE0401820.1 hypothetical protein [Gammaproteobacteria bacterium]